MSCLFLHNTVCAFFLPKTPPPLNNTKIIPKKEMVKFLTNIRSIDLKKASELIFRVIFKNIKPRSDFNLLAAIETVTSYEKTNLYNKLYLRRVCLTVKTMKDKSSLVRRFGAEEDEELVKSLHSRYLAPLILFHDRCIVLTMKEAIGIASISQFVEKMLQGAYKEDYQNLTYLLSEGSLKKIPVVKQILRETGFQDREVIVKDSDSLFNFSVNGDSHEARSVGGFSFINSFSAGSNPNF